jgi:hypothetical protein
MITSRIVTMKLLFFLRRRPSILRPTFPKVFGRCSHPLQVRSSGCDGYFVARCQCFARLVEEFRHLSPEFLEIAVQSFCQMANSKTIHEFDECGRDPSFRVSGSEKEKNASDEAE